MNSKKVKTFMTLAGQSHNNHWDLASEETRKLGAQLLLSETLEYVIKGLGVTPEFNGQKITCADSLNYHSNGEEPNKEEILDGLCDVAYTMYWNAEALGVPLEHAFDSVCENNLEKFVKLDSWSEGLGPVERSLWDLGCGVEWPEDVQSVEVFDVDGVHYAVGKDRNGKVRKPSTFKSVDLSPYLP